MSRKGSNLAVMSVMMRKRYLSRLVCALGSVNARPPLYRHFYVINHHLKHVFADTSPFTPRYPSVATEMVSTTLTPVERMTTQEKLLLAQAVYKLGAVAWPEVSRLLLQHPCCAGRDQDIFTTEAIETAYVELMTGIGIMVCVSLPFFA